MKEDRIFIETCQISMFFHKLVCSRVEITKLDEELTILKCFYIIFNMAIWNLAENDSSLKSMNQVLETWSQRVLIQYGKPNASFLQKKKSTLY
jgi:hypothetical protein